MFSNRRLIILVLLILFSAYMFFTGIANNALWEEDEVWYVQVAREMADSGDYATLTFAGEKFFHKPPLFYWLLAISGKVFGFNEFSMRLVSALSAIGIVILAFFIGEMLFSTAVGVFSGLILATSFQFFVQAKLAYIEPLLVLFMTLAFFFFIKGYLEKKHGYYILFYAAVALATLTKGPIGILLPAGSIFLFLLFRKEFKEILSVFFNWGLLVYAVITLPWYLIETSLYGKEFWLEHFGYHQFTRFAKGAETHAEPWYYNFVSLFLGFLPWSTFLPAGLLLAARKIRQKEILLTILWAAVIFVFFTISVSKLPGYLLPAFVPLAILIAKLIVGFIRNEEGVSWAGIFGSFGFLFVLLVSVAATFLYTVSTKGPEVLGGYQDALNTLIPFVYILAGGGVAGLLAFLWRPKKPYFFLAVILWVVIVNLYFMYNIVPLVESFRPMKPLGVKISEIAQPGDKVICYDYYSRGLLYYSGRLIQEAAKPEAVIQLLKGPGKVYVVMYDAHWEKLKDKIGKKASVVYQKNHGVLISN
ncbi:MAG: glycosyltransferase family 39 protein [Candidatus Margulisbacteria bacterium]|nr:glycosyltransferase family 39 protein [Candidatus Margulisiibacteriota bacterium]MBU1021919.1 glycosyltransferase family 39 protein [Candidatus Margulisiibacteriota bacterium]MBU1728557.1 glycosyltransferase family 39 protein [Candidatus Margulisiibacteriota bacterium]MBU1954704.1 glycosyltransferase family 39 protein [Candidatus Margulisiibacteriota bacterium]